MQLLAYRLMKIKPHFFKVLVGNFAYRLRIPPAFLKNLSKESSDTVVLLDPVGGRWHVKLDKINMTKVYFDEGWHGFVEEHSLKEGYFIVFKYLGNMDFTVKIFDRTHCSTQFNFNVRKSFKAAEKRFYGSSVHSHSSQDKESGHSSRKRVIGSSSHASKRETAVEMEEIDHSSSTHEKQRFAVPNSTKGNSDLRTQKTHILPFSSKNASVKIQMKGYKLSKGILFLPLEFAKVHISSKSSSVELVNDRGQSWSVNYLVRSSRVLFAGGWLTFVRDNRLNVGDECSFEVVDDKVIHVHVNRNAAP